MLSHVQHIPNNWIQQDLLGLRSEIQGLRSEATKPKDRVHTAVGWSAI